MLAEQRDTIILNLLGRQGAVMVSEICTHCNCSSITIRRDLQRLEEQGLLRRTHGGAVLPTPQVQSSAPAPINHPSALEARLALIDRADALVVTPTDTTATRQLVERARRAGVPVIAEATRYQGANTLIAIDDHRAGVELGRWVGRYALGHIQKPVKVLDVSSAQSNTQARSRGLAIGLREILAESHVLLHVDGENYRERARQAVANALTVQPDINVISCINDDSALGALDACRAAGLDERQMLVVSFGLEGTATREMMASEGPFRASVAMFPELVGRACVDAAACAYHGCRLPERIITPFTVVTSETLERYYQKDHAAGTWDIDQGLAEKLPATDPNYALLSQCTVRAKPSRIAFVLAFGSHEWYRNVRRAMEGRARELAIALEVIDASQDMDLETDALKRAIGETAAHLVNDGDTVILDSGVTTAYLAHALRGRERLTVITNSLAVLAELRQEGAITLVSSGGVVRDGAFLVGPTAEAAFHELRADKAFIAGTGVSIAFGLSDSTLLEAATKRAMIGAAREVVLLADHTKVGVESLVKVAPLEAFHHLITDAGIGPHDRLALTRHGIEVTIAESPA